MNWVGVVLCDWPWAADVNKLPGGASSVADVIAASTARQARQQSFREGQV